VKITQVSRETQGSIKCYAEVQDIVERLNMAEDLLAIEAEEPCTDPTYLELSEMAARLGVLS
jgi:hypothetical protein